MPIIKRNPSVHAGSIKIRVTKRKGSVSVRFSARSRGEGVDLKDAVLRMGMPSTAGGITGMVEVLAERGYRAG
jgi:hypothetical protein